MSRPPLQPFSPGGLSSIAPSVPTVEVLRGAGCLFSEEVATLTRNRALSCDLRLLVVACRPWLACVFVGQPLMSLTSLGPLQLVVCGHSLGAGVASLLSIILKAECVLSLGLCPLHRFFALHRLSHACSCWSHCLFVIAGACFCAQSPLHPPLFLSPHFLARYPNLKCFAFSPPGATVSSQLSTAVSSFITPVVIGKDMVPRLSLPTVHALLGDVVGAVVQCAGPLVQASLAPML